jgi:hypothetical protein
VRPALQLCVLLAVPAAARVASACPACLGQPDRPAGTLLLLGLFLALPFVVVALVARAIRRVSS